MKKALLFIILLGLFSLSLYSPFEAFANEVSTPHIKVAGDVWLLHNDGSRLFLLPNTYYAKIDNLDETYYYVTFNGVSGKVLKTQVSTVGYHEKALGTLRDLQISDVYAEFDSINIKSKPDLSSANVVSMPIRDSFTFIGKYQTDTDLWYYIRYEQYLGYVKADRTTQPNMHFDKFVPAEKALDQPSGGETKGSKRTSVFEGFNANENVLKIVIIVGLTIPALLIIFLLFKPSKYNNSHYYD